MPIAGMIPSLQKVMAPIAGRGISRKRSREILMRAKAAPRMIRLALMATISTVCNRRRISSRHHDLPDERCRLAGSQR